MLKENDFGEVTVGVMPFITRDFVDTPFGSWLTTEGLKNKVATKKELDLWNEELTKKTAQGAFLSYVDITIVAGKKK
jgi:hypothetical protein